MSSSIEETSFAPTGKPEKILIKKTVKAFPESLKTFLENLSKIFPIYSTAPVRSKKEDKTKKGNIDAIKVFSGFFSLFGGLAVLFYPNDVFVETIGGK